jgi:RNA polymerase sigma factor (sigma-70 family)
MAEGIELLRRYAADRSEAAFAALVQQHLPLVYHAALRRTNGDTHLAEEIAQTVFANLAREAAALQHHAALTGWLYVATRHAAANAMRTEQRRKAREQEAHTMNEPTTPALSGADWEQLRPEIDSVMDELGEADRNAVLLRFFENRPYAEIGASFRITEDAARMRVERALEKLRTLLARRGITSTGAALGGLLAAQSAVAAPAGLATAVTGSVMAGAGAAATATGTAGFIAFMTTNKIVMGIAGVLALVAGGTAVYQFNEASQVRSALIELNQEMDGMKAQLSRKSSEVLAAQGKQQAAEARAASMAKAMAEGGSARNRVPIPPSTGTGTSAGKGSAAILAGKMDVLYANPEYLQLQLERTALSLRQRYTPFYRRSGMSEAQIKEFESLLLEQQQAMLDVFAAARSKGVSVNDPALGRLSDPALGSVEEKLKTLLGAERFAEYKDYSQAMTGNARSTVDSLASRLYTSDPITAEQADKLVRVIVANTQKPSGGGFFKDNGPTDWSAIYAQAKDILSPPQLAALESSNRLTEISRLQQQLSDRLLQEAAVSTAK